MTETEPKSEKLAAARPFLEARAKGRAAGRVGRPLSECPYSPSEQEAEARIWLTGHREGREERHAEGTALPEKRRAKLATKDD
ncbi:MAG: hypothetical protein L0G46_03200 [Kocuria sp.]|nr:hypothetical protein [Kocuria sp.]